MMNTYESPSENPAPGTQLPSEICIKEWMGAYGAELLRSAYLFLRDHHEAEDCVQDGFLRAFRALEAGQIVDHPRAWLYKIVGNLARNRLRSRATYPQLMDELPEPASDGDGPMEAQLRRLAVAEALNELPDELRQLVVLRYYGNFTDHEIGQIVGIETGTVKSRLFRARSALAGSRALSEQT